MTVLYGGPQPPNSGCALCIGVNARWGECSLLLAFVLGIHPNLSLALAFTPNSGLKVDAKDECQGRMQRVEHQGRMQRVLNPNAQNLKHTLNLAAVVHHSIRIDMTAFVKKGGGGSKSYDCFVHKGKR